MTTTTTIIASRKRKLPLSRNRKRNNNNKNAHDDNKNKNGNDDHNSTNHKNNSNPNDSNMNNGTIAGSKEGIHNVNGKHTTNNNYNGNDDNKSVKHNNKSNNDLEKSDKNNGDNGDGKKESQSVNGKNTTNHGSPYRKEQVAATATAIDSAWKKFETKKQEEEDDDKHNNSTTKSSADTATTTDPESTTTTKKKNNKKKNTNNEDNNADYDMSWICAECKEAECVIDPSADQFLICEGPCRRIFHYPCAGLAQLPPEEETWICTDCTRQRHSCKFCQQYGIDNEDVFKCQKENCGNFFHESCLSMQNIPVTCIVAEPTTTPGDTTATEAKQFPLKRRFTCPAHSCWTCTQEELLSKEEEEEEDITTNNNKKGRRRKKRKKPTTSVFACKGLQRVYQCLECPISYHASCIPPTARFHELALLCHEHASTCKLPDLDEENSLQQIYENVIDKRLQDSIDKLQRQQQKKNKRIKQRDDDDDDSNNDVNKESDNLFFPGMFGNRITQRETTILDKLAGMLRPSDNKNKHKNKNFLHPKKKRQLAFCLPCDVKDEVHSKPPSYKHAYTNRYDPVNRPKRLRPTDEVCNCIDVCGEDCMNRVMMVECCADNCRLGPNCGNRMIGERKSTRCKPKREQGKGWGLITVDGVKKGQLVQEYTGEIINEKEKERRLSEWNKEHPNDPNFYLMALSNGWYIDARHVANLSRFINHSCDPNCILLRMNVDGYMRNGIFALRDLAPGEFLNYDYHFDTKHGDKFVCRCGAANCRGTMQEAKAAAELSSQLGQYINDDNNANKKKIWETQKAQFLRDKKFMQDYFDRQNQNLSLVSANVPDCSNQDEMVANGVQDRYRNPAREHRIFLWRNAVLGSDFSQRTDSGANRAAKNHAQKPAATKHVDLISRIFK